MTEVAVHETISTYEPLTFELSEEIATHKGSTRTLTLNMVRIGTYLKYGSPFVIETDPKTNLRREVFNFPAVMGFLADSTGHDSMVLSKIPASDVMGLSYRILEMLSFQPRPKSSDKSGSKASSGS